MEKSLVGSKVCERCEHHADVCDCEDKSRVILFEEYIEKKYHKYHTDRPEECYQRFIRSQSSSRGVKE